MGRVPASHVCAGTRRWDHTFPSNNKTHGYDLDGECVPGITTVIGIMDKPALPWWYGMEAAICARTDPTLSTMDETQARKWIANAGNRSKDAAADIGTRVHLFAEAHQRGVELPDVTFDLAAMVANYLDFMETFNPTVHVTEFVVMHRGLRYGATGDAVMDICHPLYGNKRLYVDYKTGGRKRGACYPEHGLQAAGIRGAEFLLDGDRELPVPETDGAAILHIRPDFWELIEVDAGPDAFHAFAGVRQAFDWHRDFTPGPMLSGGIEAPQEDLLAGMR